MVLPFGGAPYGLGFPRVSPKGCSAPMTLVFSTDPCFFPGPPNLRTPPGYLTTRPGLIGPNMGTILSRICFAHPPKNIGATFHDLVFAFPAQFFWGPTSFPHCVSRFSRHSPERSWSLPTIFRGFSHKSPAPYGLGAAHILEVAAPILPAPPNSLTSKADQILHAPHEGPTPCYTYAYNKGLLMPREERVATENDGLKGGESQRSTPCLDSQRKQHS